MFRFLRRLRRQRRQPEPLLRAATVYPTRSGAYAARDTWADEPTALHSQLPLLPRGAEHRNRWCVRG